MSVAGKFMYIFHPFSFDFSEVMSGGVEKTLEFLERSFSLYNARQESVERFAVFTFFVLHEEIEDRPANGADSVPESTASI